MVCLSADMLTAQTVRTPMRSNSTGLRAVCRRPTARLPARRVQVVRSATTVASNEKLKYDDLVAYIASGCKPKDKWRSYSIYMFSSSFCTCDPNSEFVPRHPLREYEV
eukprot:4093551-Pyramimonas_sp.AAC.2